MPKTFIQSLVNFYFPDLCPLCRLHSANHGVCEYCINTLPWQKQCCPICAEPGTSHHVCGKCLHRKPAFDQIIAPLLYEGVVKKSISQLKFHQQLKHTRWLSHMMQKHLASLAIVDKPDVLLPVPLHKIRIKERGYNQALELTKALVKFFSISMDRRSLCKIRATPPQSEQNFKVRQQNIKKAFQVKKDFTGQHVCIVDDVVTTGSTVNEIAKLLKKHGARKVSVWAVARTAL